MPTEPGPVIEESFTEANTSEPRSSVNRVPLRMNFKLPEFLVVVLPTTIVVNTPPMFLKIAAWYWPPPMSRNWA